MATLFISSAKLKNDTALSGSVDDNMIHPYILNAQTKEIFPYLGTDLYNKLISDIAGTPSGVYKTLLDEYIQPALVQFAFADLLPFLRLRFVNNSVVIMGTENGASATYEDLQPVIERATNLGQFYRERMIEYLDHNSSSFPEYTSNTGADLSPTHRNYFVGMNLDVNADICSNQEKGFRAAIGNKDCC